MAVQGSVNQMRSDLPAAIQALKFHAFFLQLTHATGYAPAFGDHGVGCEERSVQTPQDWK